MNDEHTRETHEMLARLRDSHYLGCKPQLARLAGLAVGYPVIMTTNTLAKKTGQLIVSQLTRRGKTALASNIVKTLGTRLALGAVPGLGWATVVWSAVEFLLTVRDMTDLPSEDALCSTLPAKLGRRGRTDLMWLAISRIANGEFVNEDKLAEVGLATQDLSKLDSPVKCVTACIASFNAAMPQLDESYNALIEEVQALLSFILVTHVIPRPYITFVRRCLDWYDRHFLQCSDLSDAMCHGSLYASLIARELYMYAVRVLPAIKTGRKWVAIEKALLSTPAVCLTVSDAYNYALPTLNGLASSIVITTQHMASAAIAGQDIGDWHVRVDPDSLAATFGTSATSAQAYAVDRTQLGVFADDVENIAEGLSLGASTLGNDLTGR